MKTKDLNLINVMLADKKCTNQWLTKQLFKVTSTVSKWYTNSAKPNLENLIEITIC